MPLFLDWNFCIKGMFFTGVNMAVLFTLSTMKIPSGQYVQHFMSHKHFFFCVKIMYVVEVHDLSETWNSYEAWKWPKAEERPWLQHWIINCLWCKEIEGPVMIAYDVNWMCEGPFEVTYWKIPNHHNWTRCCIVVYSNVFWIKSNVWAYDNQKSYVFFSFFLMKWK